jgi:hypothetical protein
MESTKSRMWESIASEAGGAECEDEAAIESG